MKEVFLGGTCNNSQWRESLIPLLTINYFNPVVPNWNEAAAALELEKRETSDYVLYVITPKMTGVYSIAEVVDDSNKRPEKTIFCYLTFDGEQKFSAAQIKSLEQTGKMIKKNGAQFFKTFAEVSDYLNNH